MLAVVTFSAIRGEYLKFNERITWPFSKRRATDVNTIRCNEIVKRVSFCMSLWRQPLAVAAESQLCPLHNPFCTSPVGLSWFTVGVWPASLFPTHLEGGVQTRTLSKTWTKAQEQPIILPQSTRSS